MIKYKMPAHQCDLCNKVFKLKTDLERHKEKKTPCVSADKIIEKHKNEIIENKNTAEDLKKLKKFFDDCHNVLRDKEGMIGLKALNNISMLLFLKFVNNNVKDNTIDLLNIEKYRGKEGEKNQDFQKYKEYIKYCDITKIVEDGKLKVDINELPIIIEYIFKHVLQHHPKTCNIFRDEIPTIKGEKTYDKIIKDMDKLNLDDIDIDIKGSAYELFLKYETGGGSLGQFFTKREVVDYIINVIKPYINENSTVIDPFMGTGGFITHMLTEIKEIYKKKNIPFTDKIKNNLMNGIEKNPQTLLLALNNMLLNSDLYPDNVKNDDTFRNYIGEKYDFVLTNPPFGIDGLDYDDTDMFPEINESNKIKKKDYIPVKSSDAICLALQLIPFILKKNGIACVIVPDGKQMTSEKEKSLVEVRKLLVENNNLFQITKLPSGTFLPYTGVETLILFFKKGEQTKEIKYVKLENDYKTEKIIGNVNIKKIRERKYSLNYKLYIDLNKINYKNLEYKKISEITNFFPKSKRFASFGNISGEYPFYTSSSELTKFCDECDYVEESIIIGTGGNANIKIAKNFSCSADNIIIKTNPDINTKYLYYYLFVNINILEDLFHGTTIKHISKSDFENLQIPVPSIEIQNLIVKELDLMYREKERLKASAKDTELLKQIHFDSLLLKCKDKQTVKLGDVCDVKTGKNKPSDGLEEGKKYPYYGTGGITGYTNEYLVDGEYLLTPRNGSVGTVFMCNGKSFPSDHVFIIKPNDKILTKFLNYTLSNNDLAYHKTGAIIPNITREILINNEINLVSIKDQEEIVTQMDKHDERVKCQEQEIELINKLIKERFEYHLQKCKDTKDKPKEEQKMGDSDDEKKKKTEKDKKVKVKSKKQKNNLDSEEEKPNKKSFKM
jgi:type I restriction enzyme S subunit